MLDYNINEPTTEYDETEDFTEKSRRRGERRKMNFKKAVNRLLVATRKGIAGNSLHQYSKNNIRPKTDKNKTKLQGANGAVSAILIPMEHVDLSGETNHRNEDNRNFKASDQRRFDRCAFTDSDVFDETKTAIA